MNSKTLRTSILLIGLVCIVACTPIQPTVTQDQPYEFIRGAVIRDHGNFSVTPCFSQTRRQLLDKSGALEKRYLEQAPTANVPVYMELWAYQRVDLMWELYGVNLAGGGVKACETELRDARFRSGGLDPAWVADIYSDRIRVEIQSDLRSIVFPLNKNNGIQNHWVSHIKTSSGASYDLSLQLTRQSCRDAVGAWYPYAAAMILDGREFKGCAREGDLASRSIPGRYSNDLQPDQAFVVLDLLNDNTVKMLLDYRNGEPLSIMEGHWSWTANERLELRFTRVNGREQQTILLMKHNELGGLEPSGFSDVFGNSKLVLKRSE